MNRLFSFVAVVCMFSPTIFSLLVPPPTDPLSLFKWKLVLILISAIGVVAFAAHLYFQGRDEKRKEEENQKHLARQSETIQEMSANISLLRGHFLSPKGTQQPTEPPELLGVPGEANSLRVRLATLGREILAFLGEKGPRPPSVVDRSLSVYDNLKKTIETHGPWVEGVHYGFERKFKDRVKDMVLELKENGIDGPELDFPLDPQVNTGQGVRAIGENFLRLSSRMEVEDILGSRKRKSTDKVWERGDEGK